MLSLEEAQARVLSAITPLGNELVPLGSSFARIAGENVLASLDLPAFDNPAMDGFAVRAEDVREASATNPVRLRVIATVAAGDEPSPGLAPQTSVRVFTGSPLPPGSDAVVMQEDTRTTGDFVEVLDAAKPREHVRFRGEDVKRGDALVRAGERLTIGQLSVLAATGASGVCVGKKPIIAILSTGDELVEAGTPLANGKIYESNRATLSLLIAQSGGIAVSLPLVPDTLAATRAALDHAFGQADAVITTGGVSVGERDFVKTAFEEIGGVQEFWKVAIRPGKPFVFGRWREQFLFGLPGNPVSAFVTFLMLVRPALLRWQGASETGLSIRRAVLAESFSNPGERRHFVRVALDRGGAVRSTG
ncbi:MAG TPA: gephyrin-like molybdotransferase Glp, partial [Candidatus Acidoferrum sp.]|nr:gephyrin-like molybdotransferase Glp [Candidatus Acidoferrum sp.]